MLTEETAEQTNRRTDRQTDHRHTEIQIDDWLFARNKRCDNFWASALFIKIHCSSFSVCFVEEMHWRLRPVRFSSVELSLIIFNDHVLAK